MRVIPFVLIFIILSSGCLQASSSLSESTPSAPESSETMSPSQEISEVSCIRPGYGEFNAKNIFFNLTDEHKRLEESLAFLMPPNNTIDVKGLLVAKKYTVNQKECYYEGNVEFKAFLGDSNFSNSWSFVQSRLRKVENISVEILPKETTISKNKNATFEIKIKTENVRIGETYYIYIVALGENGWKSWARIEVKIWGLEKTSH